jgi:adenosylcobalamin-dependent ribonucleoside-triphosphate reductase
VKSNGVEFELKDSFLNKYKRKTIPWGGQGLGYFTYKRTYARPISNTKTEEWWQTVRRVVEGCFLLQKRYCADWQLPWNERKSQKSAQVMYNLMYNFKFLPAGRGLWSMGTDFMFRKGSACLNSCGFISTEEINLEFSMPFTWQMDMSLLGVGVGFDWKGADLGVYLKKPRIDKETHVVEDSREGWVEIFRRVLDAYAGKDTLPMKVDYTEIRPEGSPIKGFGGIAPGPEPLKKLVARALLKCEEYLKADQQIDSSFIVDMMNFSGAAVMAGGIRRTAQIAFGLPEDEEFLDLKTEENINNPDLARWASNNSLMATVGMDYTEAASRSAENGEPGYFWLDNARAYGRTSDGKTWDDNRVAGCNPCGEQSLESGELCNLVETFPSRHENIADYMNTLKYAYLYAKTTTLLPTHVPRTNAIMFRNRRIGISQSGIIEQINKVGFREHINWCEEGYQKLQHWDQVYSDWLCVPRSRKTTTVKPSGSVSLLPGVTPGIHWPHAEYYLRRVRISKTSALVPILKEAGYRVEPDHYESDQTVVVEFPVHEPYFGRSKDEISIWEQLELAAAMQAKWSDNQVSITVTVRPEEAQDLPRALSMYEKRLKAVSFLPLRGDKVYKQPPYEKISEEEYKKAVDKIKNVRYHVLETEDRVEERFCDTDQCTI